MALINGFNPNFIDNDGNTIFHRGHHSDNLPLAIKYGFNINIKNKDGDTIFHKGHHQCHLQKAVIDWGFNINSLNNFKKTIFEDECHLSNIDFAISNGIDIGLCFRHNNMITFLKTILQKEIIPHYSIFKNHDYYYEYKLEYFRVLKNQIYKLTGKKSKEFSNLFDIKIAYYFYKKLILLNNVNETR